MTLLMFFAALMSIIIYCSSGIRAVTDVANVCKYQGMYNTNLTHKGYRRLIADTFKQVQAHTTRNFSIREHVALRHGKYNKNPFNRVVYRLYGKTTILSITTNDTGAEDSSKRNASKQDIKIKEKGTGKDQEQEKKEKMNWKQLVQVGLSDSKGRAVKVQKVIGEEKEQGGNRPTESSDTPAKRRPTIKDIASIISHQNIAAKQQVATKEQMEKLEEQSAREQRRLELATQAASDKKEQENAWYYDAEEEEQEEMFEQVVHKRTLETFESTKYNVTEVIRRSQMCSDQCLFVSFLFHPFSSFLCSCLCLHFLMPVYCFGVCVYI